MTKYQKETPLFTLADVLKPPQVHGVTKYQKANQKTALSILVEKSLAVNQKR